jgi:glycosyltransferase involved in cell wall biosynthesis
MQLRSILPQLNHDDEVIISDDHSTDDTLTILRSYNDPRITILENSSRRGVLKNFERSLSYSKGEVIFLCDQDDVWLPSKVTTMLTHLKHHDVVISDCLIVDDALRDGESFFAKNGSGKGFIRNMIKNSYVGCCMGFRRKVLERALPFPTDVLMHDLWIGMIGELYFDVKFIPDVLILHRRHLNNASTTGMMSARPWPERIMHRYKILKNLFSHKVYAR